MSDAFIGKVWRVMEDTPHHHYQILTKRPERMASVVATQIGKVLSNVWLGTSIESAEVAERIDHLRTVPAAIRFLSFEPLIGAVGAVDLSGIQWAIVGGESGRSPLALWLANCMAPSCCLVRIFRLPPSVIGTFAAKALRTSLAAD